VEREVRGLNRDPAVRKLSKPVTERDHIRGSLEAPVQLVEYADYECPHCGRAYWVIKQLRDELGDRLAVVFRNFPVTEVHPRAQSVAEALEAASAQGFFWEMHDWFYEHQHELEGLDLERHARVLGLDMERWHRDTLRGAYRDRVREDMESGRESGILGTPTFFINEVLHEGSYEHDALVSAIQEAHSKRSS
jgi:protein-disulfide isomerase